MVYRIYDANLFFTLHPEKEKVVGFNPDDYVVGSKNVILTDGRNYAVFDYFTNDIRIGHVFMVDRGKEALLAGKEFLSEIFSTYNVKAVMGFTPVENRAASVFNRLLGFKSRGLIETDAGLAEGFTLTQEDYNG